MHGRPSRDEGSDRRAREPRPRRLRPPGEDVKSGPLERVYGGQSPARECRHGASGPATQPPAERFARGGLEELTNLAEKIYSEFPHSIFFTSKLIFERELVYPSAAQ